MDHGLTVTPVARSLPAPSVARPHTPLAAIGHARPGAARALARIAPVATPDMKFNAGL